MTPQARKELKRAAEAAIEASPSQMDEWTAEYSGSEDMDNFMLGPLDEERGGVYCSILEGTLTYSERRNQAFASFLKWAANPTAILSLLEALEEKDGEIERLRKEAAEEEDQFNIMDRLHAHETAKTHNLTTERDALRSQNEELREALGEFEPSRARAATQEGES